MMNILLLVIDSLRMQSLTLDPGCSDTPFLADLSNQSVFFERAYATECWTLPTHMSMFTGLMPSEHGAHFQSMRYSGKAPTIAQILGQRGYNTELITRNSIFDGSLPGVTDGFQEVNYPMAELPFSGSPLLALFALAKPRVRRSMRESGFFNELQKGEDGFFWRLVRMGLPADHLALTLTLERLEAYRKNSTPFFLFVNLYDVHAPYPPTEHSPMWPLDSWAHTVANFHAAMALPKIGSHAYLKEGFRLSAAAAEALQGRYLQAIRLVDQKLERFFREAHGHSLLENTLVVVTSDHGESFGEHGLFLHDASVYNTHLHVPLWILSADLPPERIEEVVSTRCLFNLFLGAAGDEIRERTLLDPDIRRVSDFACAEHFYYPHGKNVRERYRQNQRSLITRSQKVIKRGASIEKFNLNDDPFEQHPDTFDPPTPGAFSYEEVSAPARGAFEAQLKSLLE